MKNTPFLILLVLSLVLSKKHHLRHKLRMKNTGFASLMAGQIIDNKFALHERIRWFTKESNTQLWKAISISGQNQVVTLKFYDDFKEALEAEGDAMATDSRLLRRSDIPDLGKHFLVAEKTQETRIEPDYTDETTTTLVKCVTPEIPEAPVKPKNTGGDSPEEVAYDKYMHILLYNAFENPKGQSIHNSCKEVQCKEKLKVVARGVVSLLMIMYKPDINLPFGNIHRNNRLITLRGEHILRRRYPPHRHGQHVQH